MRVSGVARGLITRRARRWLPALSGFAVALGTGCGAAAGGDAEADEGTTESVNALSAGDASGASASASSSEAAAGSGASGSEGGGELAASGGPPVTAPPSAEPAPLPHAALDTPRSLGRLAPAEVVIEPGECRFEFLGELVRCENAGWPNVLETDAPDLETCMRRCLERDDCTAVTDYLWMGLPDLGCYLYLSTCDEPRLEPVWGEEDGGRDFRRRCDDAGTD